jgi:hypothetical protein
MKKAFAIKEVRPGIFLFEFKNNYDMCMYFLRYQEFYESSSPKFRGKSFDIFEFMRWYAFKYGKGMFTYPNDWNGFNIPGDIIKKVHDAFILSRTIYDYEMLAAWRECNTKSNGKKFYIIGVVKGNGALDHEIAHGKFYLDPEYKKESIKMVKTLPSEIRMEMNSALKKLGYTPKVYVDETQAYMATGLTEALGKDFRTKWTEERKPFQKLFKKHSRKVT